MTTLRCTYPVTFFSLFVLGACSQNKAAEVTLIFDKAKAQSVSIASSVNMGGGFIADVAESGLIKNRACYLVHVTGPDLIVPGTGGSGDGDSCSKEGVPEIPGLGKIFGPFAYGSDAVIRVPSGSGRRIDLIGFINPYPNDPSCSQAFETRVSKSTGSQSGSKVNFVYGNYVIDAEESVPAGLQVPPEPLGKLGFFFHSNVVNLAPGPQSVVMKKLAWASAQSPESYGGNCQQSSAYVQALEPMSWRTEEEDGVFQRYCGSNLSSLPTQLTGSTEKFRCVHTSVRQGPVTLQCPAGATGLSVENAQQDYGSLTGGLVTQENLTCVNGKALWSNYKLNARTLLEYLTPSGIPEYIRFTPLVGGVPDLTRRWTAVVLADVPFQEVQEYESSSLVPATYLGGALAWLRGFKHSGDFRYVLYKDNNDVTYSKKFVIDTVSTGFKNPFLALADADVPIAEGAAFEDGFVQHSSSGSSQEPTEDVFYPSYESFEGFFSEISFSVSSGTQALMGIAVSATEGGISNQLLVYRRLGPNKPWYLVQLKEGSGDMFVDAMPVKNHHQWIDQNNNPVFEWRDSFILLNAFSIFSLNNGGQGL